MIAGVKVKKLKVIPDARGRLMEILRDDDDIFAKFGQVYVTTAFPGVVKAWHGHKFQDDNLTCVFGKVRLGLYDAREDSSTFKEVADFVISPDEPLLVHIPAMVYHGFKCIADVESIVLNTPTQHYNYENPDEIRVDPYDNAIDYDWRK